MTDYHCDICGEYFTGRSESIEIADEYGKGKIKISGHVSCVDNLYDKIKQVKNKNKKTPKQIIHEVKFKSK